MIEIAKKVNYANRGKGLEDLIDRTNEMYTYLGLADVKKVPTPMKITKRSGGMITGFVMNGEWVDYVGITHGYVILFDAKETSLKNLPLSNIHLHQYELLSKWHMYGARAFLVVKFVKENRYFYLPYCELEKFWNRMLKGGRKSIALSEFEEVATEIKLESGFLDYLGIL